MNKLCIISSLERLGYSVKKSRYCEEYHSNCPKCADPAGEDRLTVFSDGNAYCRRCGTWWSPTKFSRDFFGNEKSEVRLFRSYTRSNAITCKKVLRVVQDSLPSLCWSSFMEDLANQTVGNVRPNSWGALELERRGIRRDFADAFSVGYNERDVFVEGRLLEVDKPYVIIPQGLIVFYYKKVHGELRCIKVKVRRQKVDSSLPKYIQIYGSANQPMVFGYVSEKIPLIVESELDALVCLQEASSLIWTVALGGASKPIDEETDLLLQKAPCILWAFDQDIAGKSRYLFWKHKYPQLRAWPADRAKSPGDMSTLALYDWIVRGLERCKIAA